MIESPVRIQPRIVASSSSERDEAKQARSAAESTHGPTPRILIAGFDREENQFTRAVESYGFIPVHFSGRESTALSKIPMDCDAVIVILTNASHGLFYKVKDDYKAAGKRVFISTNGGFSTIKESFEQYFVGDLRKLLLNTNVAGRVQFLIAYHSKELGAVLSYSQIKTYVQRLFPDITEKMIDSTRGNMISSGMLTHLKRGGPYRFHGLTQKVYNKLVGDGLPVTTKWLLLDKEETPAPATSVPSIPTTAEEIAVAAGLSPQPKKLEPIDVASVPAPENKLKKEEEVSLITQTVSEMDKRQAEMDRRLIEMSRLLGYSQMDRATALTQIRLRLDQMSTGKLKALLELISEEAKV